MLRFLSSTRLTILLCLALAAVGVAGSLLHDGGAAASTRGAGNVFHSPFFLGPALLLIVNICCCTIARLQAGQFHGLRLAAFIGLHAGLVLLAAGLIVDGRYAFVGTQYYHPGEPSSLHYDWRENTEKTFPFLVEVSGYSERYLPMKLQVGVRDSAGRKVGLFVVTEGAPFRVPKTGLTLTPRRFDVGAKELTLDATADGRTETGLRVGKGGAAVPGGFVVVPVAWADPDLADSVARIRFVPASGPPETHDLRVNHPVDFEGITFCLTTSRIDEDGKRIVGLQMTREPGAPWFWFGAGLFGVSLLFGLYRRMREPEPQPDGDDGETPSSGMSSPAVTSVLLAAALLSCGWAGDAAAFGRAITADETWEGEVKVVEPVTVEKGATLTIRPGTVVLLSGEERGGAGCPDGGIQVFGRLRVEGAPGSPVRFARLDPARPWNELFIKETDAVIRYAVVEGALWGLHIHDSDVSIERTVVRGNGGGIRLRGTGVRLDRCTVRDNDIGFRFWKGGPHVTASAIEGNRIGLFYRDGAGGGKINGSRIANREIDVKIGDWAGGDLDLSGNSWGGKPRIRDFRGRDAKGKIRTRPVLKRLPAAVGAD
jgi:hypothetical protein